MNLLLGWSKLQWESKANIILDICKFFKWKLFIYFEKNHLSRPQWGRKLCDLNNLFKFDFWRYHLKIFGNNSFVTILSYRLSNFKSKSTTSYFIERYFQAKVSYYTNELPIIWSITKMPYSLYQIWIFILIINNN